MKVPFKFYLKQKSKMIEYRVFFKYFMLSYLGNNCFN